MRPEVFKGTGNINTDVAPPWPMLDEPKEERAHNYNSAIKVGLILLFALIIIGILLIIFTQEKSPDLDRVDELPPKLLSTSTSPTFSINSTSSVSIKWSTDEPATSWVMYCREDIPNGMCQDSGLRTDLVRNHDIRLDNLIPGGVYHITLKSTDASGNQAIYDLSKKLILPK